MRIAILASTFTFLVLDFAMIGLVLRPLFQEQVGHLMTTEFRPWPAAAFYLGYPAAVIWLVVRPAVRAGSLRDAVLNGAVLGAAAYGTFEFTNMALLADWQPVLVYSDVVWGAVLTAATSGAGVAAGRARSGI